MANFAGNVRGVETSAVTYHNRPFSTYHFQNFYHHVLTNTGHVLTYSSVKTFRSHRIYEISGQPEDYVGRMQYIPHSYRKNWWDQSIFTEVCLYRCCQSSLLTHLGLHHILSWKDCFIVRIHQLRYQKVRRC